MTTQTIPTNGRQAQLLERPPDFLELLKIARDAADFSPPLYISSFLGLPWTWIPPFHRYSEFRIIDLWKLRRSLRFLYRLTIPTIPLAPPTYGPPFINNFFYQPSVILQRPDHNGSYTSFPEEAWFYLNGIMTDDVVAQMNAAYLADLFHRPISLIQNATGSAAADLVECILGKEWRRTTESAVKAFPPIYDALKSSRERVVVIAHSQGTIILAIVLRLLSEITWTPAPVPHPAGAPLGPLTAAPYAEPEFVYPSGEPILLEEFEPLTPQELGKLELYCFANCANRLKYWRPPQGGARPIPWIESFGNQYDLVARLGMQAPNAAERGIDLDGPRWVRPGKWGHLLNQHYLKAIDAYQRKGYRRGGQAGCEPYELVNPEAVTAGGAPRLFAYLNGGTPEN